MREVQNGRAVGGEQHLCVYSYEGDMQNWRADLNRRIQGGDIVLKDWHHDIAFRSWDCHPVGDLLRPTEAEGRRWPSSSSATTSPTLVSPDAELTLLATGYVFTEGPVWSVARAGAVLQRHPRRPALPLDRAAAVPSSSRSRPSRATAWRTTSRAG